MSQSNEREEHIFARALAIPVAERSRFLDSECGADLDLRARVEGLLRAHESAGDFMESPPVPKISVETGPRHQGITETPGTRIGRYKLQQKIGEGGCGVVWMAEQEEPVRRQVALKIIKLGMDTREVIARFEAERQALAMLDHPNIAKILDAGATETGRPYFVMELVRGIKITDFCDRYNLSTAHRLELFAVVCNAVQHAHQKGIIHRDLKPSNILVTLNDAKPVPKVIDFGIAKATSGRLTDHTLFTAFEQFLGTPAYMSPEQAELSGIDIDTRSDIYSLGVLLYELLTGRLPFDPKTLLQAGIDEIRRIIREVEPPKPSTNLSTLGDADRGPQVARLRDTDAERLSLLLRGDLDWIVMRCLEKDRSRRYETPNALAADIGRHLNNEPVVARPPSRGYRLERMIRRNRLAFAAVVSVALALLSGFGISTWQAVRATRAERRADNERARAVEERSKAEDLLKFMLGDLYKQLDRVGRLDVLDSVADKATSYFATLSPFDLDDTTQLARAKATRLVGGVRLAQVRYTDALAAFTDGYNRSVAIVSLHPKSVEALAERFEDENGIGNVYWDRNEFRGAQVWFSRSRDTCAALVVLDPNRDRKSDLSEAELNLASVSYQLGDLDAARATLLTTLPILEKLAQEDPSNAEIRGRRAEANNLLGYIAVTDGEFTEALARYNAQMAQLEAMAAADPKSMDPMYSQAVALLAIVNVETATGDYAAAQASLSQARKRLETLVAHDEKNVDWASLLLNAKLDGASLALVAGDNAGAIGIVDDVRPKLEAIVAKEPTALDCSEWLLAALSIEARAKIRTGDPGAAATAAGAVRLAEHLSEMPDATDHLLGKCADVLVLGGDVAETAGDPVAARRYWARALELLGPRDWGARSWRLLDPLARAYARLGRISAAEGAIDKLTHLGYVPVNPWPDLKGSDAAKSPDPQQK